MIRMSKLTDYGFVVLSRFTQHGQDALVNAPDLAAETGLPLPTVSKLLKILTKNGLLQAHRGVKGGYSLARSASAISATEVIEALEGPLAFTDCTSPDGEYGCAIEENCPNKSHWRQITTVVRDALSQVSLAELGRNEHGVGTKSADRLHRHTTQSANGCASGLCGGAGPACTCGHEESENIDFLSSIRGLGK